MSKAASPKRGQPGGPVLLAHWAKPLSSTEVLEKQLPDLVGITVTGGFVASISASLPWEGQKSHASHYSQVSPPLFPLPPGRLQLPAPGPLGSGP